MSEGQRSFYRQHWSPLTMIQFLLARVKLHDKWDLRLEISSTEL
jgi:hypothetical protein